MQQQVPFCSARTLRFRSAEQQRWVTVTDTFEGLISTTLLSRETFVPWIGVPANTKFYHTLTLLQAMGSRRPVEIISRIQRAKDRNEIALPMQLLTKQFNEGDQFTDNIFMQSLNGLGNGRHLHFEFARLRHTNDDWKIFLLVPVRIQVQIQPMQPIRLHFMAQLLEATSYQTQKKEILKIFNCRDHLLSMAPPSFGECDAIAFNMAMASAKSRYVLWRWIVASRILSSVKSLAFLFVVTS
jgi:hypothetical protein